MPKKKGSKRRTGWKLRPEVKKKISERMMGNTHTKGLKHTAETKKKMSEMKRGPKGSNWKGGRRKVNGYILICLDHPFSNADRCVFEHRLVMENYLDRFLTREEVVHHINDKKDDNRIENLMLFPNNAGHKAYHAQLRKIAQQKGVKS